MRYPSVLGGLFLSFIFLFGLGSTASISTSQTGDIHLHAREFKKAGFSKKCWDYHWSNETCILGATCQVDKKKPYMYTSEIDVNTCLANFVPKDATADNEDSEDNFNHGLLNWHFAPMEVYRLKKASGKAILKNACQDRNKCYIDQGDLNKGKPVLQCAKQRGRRTYIQLDIGIGLDDKGQLGCLAKPEE